MSRIDFFGWLSRQSGIIIALIYSQKFNQKTFKIFVL